MTPIDWGELARTLGPAIAGLIAAVTAAIYVKNKWETWKLNQRRREVERHEQLEDKLVAQYEKRIGQLEDNEVRQQNALEALEQMLNRAHQNEERLEKDVAILGGQVKSLQEDLNRKTTELHRVRDDLDKAQLRIRELEIDKARLEEQNRALIAQNEMMSAMVQRWDNLLPEFTRLITATAKQTIEPT